MASTDPGYDKRLQTIREIVRNAWKRGTPIPWITDHGVQHCQNVENLIHEVLPQDKMNTLELQERFLLLAAAWLHDIGMNASLFASAPENGDKTVEEIGGLADEDRDRYFKGVRNEHAERSARYASEAPFHLEPHERGALEHLCRLHRYKAYGELHRMGWRTDEGVRLPLLVAYLRVADALHIPRREDTDARDYVKYLALGMDHKTKFHWLKSRYARSVKATPDDFSVTIKLRRPKGVEPDDWARETSPLAKVIVREVQDELDAVEDILGKGGLAFYRTVKCEPTDEVNAEAWTDADIGQLRELTGNIGLFSPTLTPNAGEVSNSVLDTISVLAEGRDAVSLLARYRENVLADLLRTRPCHVFLSKIQSGLDARLSDATTPDEGQKAQAIKEWARLLRERRKDAVEGLPSAACGILRGSSAFLVYGLSESVVKCLDALSPEEKGTLTVYVCEASTKTDHRYNNRLVHYDGGKYAERIREAGIANIKLVPDSGVSHLLWKVHRYPELGVQQRTISAVLFGANGVGLDGSVGHSLGHLTIADAAARYGTPVYVIADSFKIGRKIDELGRSDPLRDSQWLPTDIEWEGRLEGIEAHNPREDIVPPDRITAIITEKGVVSPEEVWTHRPEEIPDFLSSTEMAPSTR